LTIITSFTFPPDDVDLISYHTHHPLLQASQLEEQGLALALGYPKAQTIHPAVVVAEMEPVDRLDLAAPQALGHPLAHTQAELVEVWVVALDCT
jgi:hypothetical protein